MNQNEFVAIFIELRLDDLPIKFLARYNIERINLNYDIVIYL